ncbi:protein N-terminal asparagine amidohydrolase [Apostasia shenzhenica]|uniref:Protein N-terminal asparagine amidohydrolase n=1 Tax=Apostasia shenzhenica TaxID=1088818 RepID=A0A2I0ABA4_9ASPA|nr:protein N-terminal asparagine amidohydrolase [Apostasia shenzhenica]
MDQGIDILASLLEHPKMIAASDRLKATPENHVSFAEGSPPVKLVYVFQKEYATVDSARVEVVGTDEATTCVGLVIRNPKTKMTSVGHMDFINVVDMGVSQMLSLVVDDDLDTTLDVHLIGSFLDVPCESANNSNQSRTDVILRGYSFPLCSKIVEALHKRLERFQVQTFCVLSHNTTSDFHGNAVPIVSGFLVDTSCGSIVPARFNKTSRCPDEIVRRIRVTVSSEDPYWKGKLLETYDTIHDRFVIGHCSWMPDWEEIAYSLQQLSDSEILIRCSTSPAAEAPDFVENERR